MLRLSINGKAAVIEVEDTGLGIPEEKIPLIFDRFFRVDESRQQDKGGSGLGLSICRSIINSHNGTIPVRSKLGEGSSFRIELPLS